jgi:hypothetical protein
MFVRLNETWKRSMGGNDCSKHVAQMRTRIPDFKTNKPNAMIISREWLATIKTGGKILTVQEVLAQ